MSLLGLQIVFCGLWGLATDGAGKAGGSSGSAGGSGASVSDSLVSISSSCGGAAGCLLVVGRTDLSYE